MMERPILYARLDPQEAGSLLVLLLRGNIYTQVSSQHALFALIAKKMQTDLKIMTWTGSGWIETKIEDLPRNKTCYVKIVEIQGETNEGLSGGELSRRERENKERQSPLLQIIRRSSGDS